MPDFQLSLAPSRLSQVINPWSLSLGSLFTVNLGNAGDTETEQRMLNEVGSYGRQIGQLPVDQRRFTGTGRRGRPRDR